MGYFRVNNGETYTAPVSGAKIIGVTSVGSTSILLRNVAGVQVISNTFANLTGHDAQQFSIPGGFSIQVSGGAGQHASVSDGD